MKPETTRRSVHGSPVAAAVSPLAERPVDPAKRTAYERFLGYLRSATPGVGETYMRLPIAGRDNPIFRERVYCYELYHHIRGQMENATETEYTFNGEVDKRGHPIFVDIPCAQRKIPDFLIHVPGDEHGNLVVMEVKPISCDRRGVRKDLNTIHCFLRKVNYYKGIFLIYGDDFDETGHSLADDWLTSIKGWATEWRLSQRPADRIEDIEIVWHRSAKAGPVTVWRG